MNSSKYLRIGCEQCDRLCMIVFRVIDDQKPMCPYGKTAVFDRISEITIP